VTFGDADWRNTPELAEPMFAAFTVMRQLHELLWCLAEAATLTAPGQLADDVECAGQRTAELTRARAAELAAVDTGAFRRGFGPLLERVSRSVRDGLCQTRHQTSPASAAPAWDRTETTCHPDLRDA